MDVPATVTVTLHSSWRGIVTNVLGALFVLGGGLLAVSIRGWTVLASIVVGLGVVFCVVVALDYPVAATFAPTGVTRRMIARRQHLGWNRVDQLTRARPGVAAGFRGLAHGGLVALVGRRRYLLVDRCESLDEFEALEQLLVDRPGLMELVPRSLASVEPTWLYRRSRWAPQRPSRR